MSIYTRCAFRSLCGFLLFCLAAIRPANASLIFEFSSECVSDCGRIGLVDGAPISGTIEFDSTDFAPGATVSSEDVLDYSLVFGDLSLVFDADDTFPFFDGELNATESAYGSVSHREFPNGVQRACYR